MLLTELFMVLLTELDSDEMLLKPIEPSVQCGLNAKFTLTISAVKVVFPPRAPFECAPFTPEKTVYNYRYLASLILIFHFVAKPVNL